VPGAEANDAGLARGETERREDLRDDLAAIDAALADLNKRLEVARDATRAELQRQLVALQERDDALKAQVQAAGVRADADANSARRQIHRAILSLKSDMQRIADRIQR
jgi:predicted  nucleic acid-binding Zn-ribbon protein